MTGRLEGKTAIITGADSRFGSSLAYRLATEGANIVLHYTNARSEMNAMIRKVNENGGKAILIRSDLTTPRGVKAVFDLAASRFQGTDVLINGWAFNSKVNGSPTNRELDNLLKSTTKATFLACELASERMKDGGCIVNLSLFSPTSPWPLDAIYASTAGAISNLSRVFEETMKPRSRGISVNVLTADSISPALTDTEQNVWRSYETMKASHLILTGYAAEAKYVALWLATEEMRRIADCDTRSRNPVATENQQIQRSANTEHSENSTA